MKNKNSLTIRTSFVNSSGLNLGGLGCGGIELWPDGTFHHPQFLNNRPWARMRDQPDNGYSPAEPRFLPEDMYFLLRVKEEGKPVQMRFLMVGHGSSFIAMGCLSRTYKYATCPAVQAIEYDGEFPFINLKYIDDRLPITLKLSAWTPFIPHDPLESSTPGCVFDFQVESKSSVPVEVSLLYVASNLSGWEQNPFAHDHSQQGFEGATLIKMAGGSNPEHPTTGNMSIFAKPHDGQKLTTISRNPYLENLYLSIHTTGQLDGPLKPDWMKREEYLGNAETNDYYRTRGWLCMKETVAPSKSSQFRFGLTWYYPNHFAASKRRIGKFYENRFTDSAAVAQHLIKNADSLKEKSARLPQAFRESNLDPKFAASLLDQLSTLTKASFYTKAGEYFLWEGLGSCGMNTVDVQHYASFGVLHLFPSIQCEVIDMTGRSQRESDGMIPHAFTQGGNETEISPSEYGRWDVNVQYILSLYRDWRWTGNAKLLDDNYSRAVKSFDLLASLDIYGVGLPYIESGITYDHWSMKGVVAYMAGLYISGAQAIAEMARTRGDVATVDRMNVIIKKGTASFEKLLYTGDRYALFFKKHYEGVQETTYDHGADLSQIRKVADFIKTAKFIKDEQNEGLQTDALNGHSYSTIVGLPPFLKSSRVRSMFKAVLKENTHQDAHFLANGSYKDGHYPDQFSFAQWQNPWTGTEHFFIASLFAEGMEKEGLKVLHDLFDRLSSEGMRFNHIEANTQYARPLSIYAAYDAWLGIDFDVPGKLLHLLPKTSQKDIQVPLILPSVVGKLSLNRTDKLRLEITIEEGKAPLQLLELPLAADASVKVQFNGQEVVAQLKPSDKKGAAILQLAHELVLASGAKLTVVQI